MNTTTAPVVPDQQTAPNKARAKRRAQVREMFPSAGRFLDEVSGHIRRGARGTPEQVAKDIHVADCLDRFVDYLVMGKDIPPPPPVAMQDKAS